MLACRQNSPDPLPPSPTLPKKTTLRRGHPFSPKGGKSKESKSGLLPFPRDVLAIVPAGWSSAACHGSGFPPWESGQGIKAHSRLTGEFMIWQSAALAPVCEVMPWLAAGSAWLEVSRCFGLEFYRSSTLWDHLPVVPVRVLGSVLALELGTEGGFVLGSVSRSVELLGKHEL